ncbi:hypothetical protein [Rhizobium sp. No.120]
MTDEQAEMTRDIVGAMRSFNNMLREAGSLGLKVDLNILRMFLSRAGGQIQLIDLAIAVRNHPQA